MEIVDADVRKTKNDKKVEVAHAFINFLTGGDTYETL